jgi:hypothetical protein
MTLSIAQVICPKFDSNLRPSGGNKSNICPSLNLGEGKKKKVKYTIH